MKEKLEFLLREKGHTATSLARLLEIQPSGISHILSGRNKPSFDFVVKILRAFPDVSPDWLLLGVGAPLRRGAADDEQLPPTKALDLDEPLFSVAENIEILEGENFSKNENAPIFSMPKSGGKKIERVIILYSDHSFDSYTY